MCGNLKERHVESFKKAFNGKNRVICIMGTQESGVHFVTLECFLKTGVTNLRDSLESYSFKGGGRDLSNLVYYNRLVAFQASVYRILSRSISFVVVKSKQQLSNSNDCPWFSVANIESLCGGNLPEKDPAVPSGLQCKGLSLALRKRIVSEVILQTQK